MKTGDKKTKLGQMIKKTEKIVLYLSSLFLIFIFLLFFIDFIVSTSTEKKIYSSVVSIPYNKVGLLLGTSKYVPRKKINLYYKYRIEAACELFGNKKINYIIVSGDNRRIRYNEPVSMKKDLIKNGIPSEKIFLDYAGFRTFDSIVRAREIFGQKSITVISQRFHIERAIFIAERKGIDAIGFEARDLDFYTGFKIKIREKLARVKMFYDLLINKKPKYLGKNIKIE